MVEFAIAAPVFFMLLFGTLELGFIYVTNVSLGNATAQIARKVRVGQIVLPGSTVATTTGNQMTLSGFKAAICGAIQLMSPATCINQLQVGRAGPKQLRRIDDARRLDQRQPQRHGLLLLFGIARQRGNHARLHGLADHDTADAEHDVQHQLGDQRRPNHHTGTFLLLTSSESFKNEPNPNTINTGNGC